MGGVGDSHRHRMFRHTLTKVKQGPGEEACSCAAWGPPIHPFIYSLIHSFIGVCQAPAPCQEHSVLGIMAPEVNKAERAFLALTHNGESDLKQPHTWIDV